MAEIANAAAIADVEVIYFDGPGRAELTRTALRAGRVPFTDTRFSFGEWPEIKKGLPSTRFGSVPLLKHGGLLIAQSQATALYAAELGLTPNLSSSQRAYDLMYVGWHADIQAEMYKVLFAKDDVKEAATEEFKQKAPGILANVEAMLPATGFIHGAATPSLGDLAVHNACMSPFPGVVALGIDLEPYPKIVALNGSVTAFLDGLSE